MRVESASWLWYGWCRLMHRDASIFKLISQTSKQKANKQPINEPTSQPTSQAAKQAISWCTRTGMTNVHLRTRPLTPHLSQGRRYLIVVCEAKVLLIDLPTGATKEVTKSQLDGRSPVDVSMLYMGGPRYRAHGQSDAGMMPLPLMAVAL